MKLNGYQSAFLVVLLGLCLGCDRGSRFDVRGDYRRALELRERYEANAGGGAGGAAVALADPVGWGTLKGTFRVTGQLPPRVPLNVVGQDKEYCAPGGKIVYSQAILTDANGGLADVLVYLTTQIPTDDPKWEHPRYANTKTGIAEKPFDQKNCLFLSPVYAMRATQTLKILNSDAVAHNTNISPSRGAKPFNQTIGANGGSAEYPPGGASSTPFPVTCSIHPWMRANMITLGHPYFDISKADGSFEIPDVPAGVELEFRVWHEAPKFISGEFGGRSLKRGKFTVTLTDGKTEELNVDLNADMFQ